MIQKAEISEVNISANKIDPFLLIRKIAFFCHYTNDIVYNGYSEKCRRYRNTSKQTQFLVVCSCVIV